MKKKIIKIVGIVILGLILIYLAINLREAIILYKFSNKVAEYQKLTNFYYKAETESGTNLVYRKDNTFNWKLITKEDTKQIYIKDKQLWTLIENHDGSSKIAVDHGINEQTIMPGVIVDGSFYTENFWQAFLASFICRISSEEINGIDCYKIYVEDSWQMFVNKEDYIKIKEINGSTSRQIIEYSINTVTDSEVIMPSLDGYEIKEVR